MSEVEETRGRRRRKVRGEQRRDTKNTSEREEFKVQWSFPHIISPIPTKVRSSDLIRT